MGGADRDRTGRRGGDFSRSLRLFDHAPSVPPSPVWKLQVNTGTANPLLITGTQRDAHQVGRSASTASPGSLLVTTANLGGLVPRSALLLQPLGAGRAHRAQTVTFGMITAERAEYPAGVQCAVSVWRCRASNYAAGALGESGAAQAGA